jgi:hypothetical protein
MRPRDRPKVVAAGLIACVIAIAWVVWRHRDAPSVDVGFMFPETREHALERMAAESARQEAWLVRTKAWIKKDHETALGDLIKAEESLRVATCDRGRRGQLQWSIYVYAVRRTSAYHNAPNEGLVSEVAQLWETPADRSAIAIAVDLMNRGYVLQADFKEWRPEYSEIFSVPQNALSACAGSAG